MSSVEAAASLFGPEDTADPFGTIGGGDDAVSQSAAQPSHADPGSSVADLFGEETVSGQNYDAGFTSVSNGQGEYASWNGTTESANAYAYQHDYSQGATANEPSYSGYSQAQAGGDGQWSSALHNGGEQSYGNYSQNQYAAPETNAVQQSYNPTPSAYPVDTQPSPYAPDSHAPPSSMPYSNGATGPVTNAAAQSTYDPYNVAGAGTGHQAAPATVASTAAYNPYAPSNYASPPAQYSAPPSGPANAYATPPYSQYATGVVNPPVPPSPAPSAAQFRPKKLDAYDPPLPPPKVNKRVTLGATARSASPAVGQQTYPVFNAHASAYPDGRASPFGSVPNPRPPNGITSHISHANPPPPARHSSYQPTSVSAQYHPPPPAHNPPSPPVQYQPATTAHYQTSPPSQYLPPPSQNQPLPPPQHNSHPPPPAQIPPRRTASIPQAIEVPDQTAFVSSYAPALPVQFSPEWLEKPLPPSITEDNAEHRNTLNESHDPEVAPYMSQPSYSYGSTIEEPGSHQASVDAYQLTSNDSHDPYDPENHATHSLDAPLHSTDNEVATFEHAGVPWTNAEIGSTTPRSTHTADFTTTSPPPSHEPTEPVPSTVYDPYKPKAASPLASPPQVLARARSPGSSSLYGSEQDYRTRTPDFVPPPPQSISAVMQEQYHPMPSQSYEPKAHVSRVSSPSSIRSWRSRTSVQDPYAPDSHVERERSMSNSSAYSFSSTMHTSYVPQHPRQSSDLSQASPYSHHSPLLGNGVADQGQTLTVLGGVTHAAYAPSPSLLGTNDPLGRIAGRAPLISFGFGGKMVTCFHGSSTLNTGFDVALSSRQTTSVQVRLLRQEVPESALDASATPFPGPLFCDPGTPTTSLVRTTTSSQTKTNKARVIKYLEERSAEISAGLGYLSQGSSERKQAEGKLVIVNLLKVMVENDGHLSGSPQIDNAVRAALVPRLGDKTFSAPSNGPTPSLGFSSSSDTMQLASEIPYPSIGLSTLDANDTIIATSTVKASSLDKIEDFLMRGDRRQAVNHALDEKLWAHAMVIASSIDKECWKEVVNEFIKAELGTSIGSLNGRGKETSASHTREGLKVAYSLYAGQGAAAVQELAPPSLLSKPMNNLQVPSLPHITPMTPNFPTPSIPTSLPTETLTRWTETAAMMLPGPSSAECSAALMALGDCLFANQWTEAAHACYLLAPQTSVLVGLGSPSSRVILIGSRNPLNYNLNVDKDPIIFSEIAEFAMSLSTPQKGQEAFGGFPHLQPYKLIRAASLAELGHIQAAHRYCEAIAASLSRGSASVNPTFIEQLRGLSDRLVAAPHLDKSGSWMGNKMSRPSLDSIGNWLEGRLTKFIAGDGDGSPATTDEVAPNEPKGFAGPFSHYSTISSTTTSTSPSPQPTTVNYNVLPGSQPKRSGSAQAMRPLQAPQIQIDRASSAMDYRPRRSSPVPRIASANAATTSFSQAPYGYNASPYGYPNGLTPLPGISDVASENSPSHSDASVADAHNGEPTGHDSTWWGSSYTEESNAPTPTAATFYRVESGPSPSTSGFISLMDDPVITPSPGPAATHFSSHTSSTLAAHDEDEEDLGFGNSSSKRKPSNDDAPEEDKPASTSATKASNPAPTRPELKNGGPGGSWFSRWWKGGEGGPVKATLGEESSFVYDKDLKRWVNKKSGGEATTSSGPPPPPARAQTASPGHSAPRMPNGTTPIPPPARSASAIDLTMSPPRRSLNGTRPRSNLVPMAESGVPSPAGSPPPMPSGTPTPPPPPGRPKSQASKRNVRSRYVDVFQQPGA